MKTKREWNLDMNSVRDLKAIIETMEELAAALTSHPSEDVSRLQLEIIRKFRSRIDSDMMNSIEEKLLFKTKGEKS